MIGFWLLPHGMHECWLKLNDEISRMLGGWIKEISDDDDEGMRRANREISSCYVFPTVFGYGTIRTHELS